MTNPEEIDAGTNYDLTTGKGRFEATDRGLIAIRAALDRPGKLTDVVFARELFGAITNTVAVPEDDDKVMPHDVTKMMYVISSSLIMAGILDIRDPNDIKFGPRPDAGRELDRTITDLKAIADAYNHVEQDKNIIESDTYCQTVVPELHGTAQSGTGSIQVSDRTTGSDRTVLDPATATTALN